MTFKFIDLSAVTLSSAGKPNFDNSDLLPLTDELIDMVSGGVENDPTNDINYGCTNKTDCTGTKNDNCKNTGKCLFDQWPD